MSELRLYYYPYIDYMGNSCINYCTSFDVHLIVDPAVNARKSRFMLNDHTEIEMSLNNYIQDLDSNAKYSFREEILGENYQYNIRELKAIAEYLKDFNLSLYYFRLCSVIDDLEKKLNNIKFILHERSNNDNAINQRLLDVELEKIEIKKRDCMANDIWQEYTGE